VIEGFDGEHLLARVDYYEGEPWRMRLHPTSVEYFPRADQLEPGMVVRRNPVGSTASRRSWTFHGSSPVLRKAPYSSVPSMDRCGSPATGRSSGTPQHRPT
jgi:hypothetical protein